MAWFALNGKLGWATCPMTQAGFVRVLSNPAFDPAAPPMSRALELLSASTESNPHHQFWSDAIPLSRIGADLSQRIQGRNQITDAYLLALAIHHHGHFVTFDSRMESLAPKGSSEHKALLILRP
jgi:hypothetical protein